MHGGVQVGRADSTSCVIIHTAGSRHLIILQPWFVCGLNRAGFVQEHNGALGSAEL